MYVCVRQLPHAYLQDASQILDVGQLLVYLPQLVVESDEALSVAVQGVPGQGAVEQAQHLANNFHDPAETFHLTLLRCKAVSNLAPFEAV